MEKYSRIIINIDEVIHIDFKHWSIKNKYINKRKKKDNIPIDLSKLIISLFANVKFSALRLLQSYSKSISLPNLQKLKHLFKTCFLFQKIDRLN